MAARDRYSVTRRWISIGANLALTIAVMGCGANVSTPVDPQSGITVSTELSVPQSSESLPVTGALSESGTTVSANIKAPTSSSGTITHSEPGTSTAATQPKSEVITHDAVTAPSSSNPSPSPSPTITATPTPTPTRTATPTPTPTPAQTSNQLNLTNSQAEELFLIVVRDKYPNETAFMTDSSLLEVAHNTCAALDAGVTVFQIALLAIEKGVDSGLAGGMLAGAIVAFCPQYTADWEAFVQTVS